MVEVFRTNITDLSAASRIVEALGEDHVLYVANFDLDDRDRVLRVKCILGDVDVAKVIALVQRLGYWAEVMPDDIPVFPPLAYFTE